MKGSANCCLDHVEWFCHSGPTKKYGDRAQNRRSGAPGGVRAGHTARDVSHEASTCYRSAFPALRSLAHVRGKKKEAPPRASLTIGVDESRLYACKFQRHGPPPEMCDRVGR